MLRRHLDAVLRLSPESNRFQFHTPSWGQLPLLSRRERGRSPAGGWLCGYFDVELEGGNSLPAEIFADIAVTEDRHSVKYVECIVVVIEVSVEHLHDVADRIVGHTALIVANDLDEIFGVATYLCAEVGVEYLDLFHDLVNHLVGEVLCAARGEGLESFHFVEFLEFIEERGRSPAVDLFYSNAMSFCGARLTKEGSGAGVPLVEVNVVESVLLSDFVSGLTGFNEVLDLDCVGGLSGSFHFFEYEIHNL